MRSLDFRAARSLGLVLLIGLALGYVGGRAHLIGRARWAIAPPASPLPAPASTVPPGPPQDPVQSEAWIELDSLLDQRLDSQLVASAAWRELLAAKGPAERRRAGESLRKRFLAQLTPWPGPRVSLEPERQPWFATPEVDVSLVRLQTYPGLHQQFALLMPRPGTAPRPALLVLHGFDGNLQEVVEDLDYHHGFAMALARQGFVVLAPLRATASAASQSHFQIKALASGWRLEAILLWSLTRSLDYLASLDGIDQDHLGVYGISFGGQHALRLGAIDPRLSLVICSAYFTDRFAWLFKTFPLVPANHIGILPDMGVLLDDVNLAAMIAPRFFGVEGGTRDPRYAGAVRKFATVSTLYEQAGFPDRARMLTFEGGHETSVTTVLPFLREWEHTSLAQPVSRR